MLVPRFKSIPFVRVSAQVLAFALLFTGNCKTTLADLILLQNATATFSQTSFGGEPVSAAIDGNLANSNGWAIFRSDNGNASTTAETAVFETQSDAGFASGTALTFTLHQLYTSTNVQHTIGRFRLSLTTDDRSLFADGLSSNGDVSANWTVLNPLTATATNGATLTIQGDDSILASGASPATSVYTVTGVTSLTAITGFRLEVLEDPSLPSLGPGRFSNGNFVLTEFTVDVQAVPEPSSLALIATAGVAYVWRRRRASDASRLQ